MYTYFLHKTSAIYSKTIISLHMFKEGLVHKESGMKKCKVVSVLSQGCHSLSRIIFPG